MNFDELKKVIFDEMHGYYVNPKANMYDFNCNTELKGILSCFKLLKASDDISEVIVKYYFNIIQNICCEDLNLTTNDLEDFTVICDYFEELKSIELIHNCFVFSDMLPFFQKLFYSHSIETFVFCRNLIFSTPEPEQLEIQNVKSILQLMSSLKYLEFSETKFEDFVNVDITEILIDVFRHSNLESLNLSFNGIEVDNFLKLLGGLSNLRTFCVQYSVTTENPDEFYQKIFKELETSNISSLHFDEGYIDDIPTHNEKTIETIKLCMKSNYSLTTFVSPSSSINELIEPYLYRNLNTYWDPYHTLSFSNEFFKVLMTFHIINNNNTKSPKLPMILCNKIFSFFQNKML